MNKQMDGITSLGLLLNLILFLNLTRANTLFHNPQSHVLLTPKFKETYQHNIETMSKDIDY